VLLLLLMLLMLTMKHSMNLPTNKPACAHV
jgi:hypothetical protein